MTNEYRELTIEERDRLLRNIGAIVRRINVMAQAEAILNNDQIPETEKTQLRNYVQQIKELEETK